MFAVLVTTSAVHKLTLLLNSALICTLRYARTQAKKCFDSALRIFADKWEREFTGPTVRAGAQITDAAHVCCIPV